MAFGDIYSEVRGSVPKMPNDFARTLSNRALLDIYRQSLWSCLMGEANWTTPALLTGGTVSTVQGTNTVTFDATASAGITAIGLGPVPTPITQRQFRIGVGTIYNIWAMDDSNPSAVVLTLDRLYQEPTASGQPYFIEQIYYPAPAKDFFYWLGLRDMMTPSWLNTSRTRDYLDKRDVQRQFFGPSDICVPYQLDMNPASPTYGWMLFELNPVPSYVLVYQLYFVRRGLPLVNDTDTVPFCIGEDCVIERSKVFAYEWAEANKGDVPRGTGSDYRFLIQNSKAEYKRLYSDYRRQDRQMVDNFRIRPGPRTGWSVDGFYSAYANAASAGAAW